MSEASKHIPPAQVEEESHFKVFTTNFSSGLEINDFVCRENALKVGSRKQEDTDNANTEEIVKQCDANGIESSKSASVPWDKELLVEQHYWDQHGHNVEKVVSTKVKHPSSQRKSTKLSKAIAAGKAITREPAYFDLDRSTTATLETLIKEDYVGRLHNVVGRGSNTIVIHADCAYTYSKIKSTFCYGNAVKIHKLSRDAKKNMAILQRTQREYDHLVLLNRYSGITPYVVHKKRNIIIMSFEGEDHETAQSISSLPADRYEEMYHFIVRDLNIWYNKAHIVHGRLSARNMFYRIFIDYLGSVRCAMSILGWSHSVQADHPQALKKLMRDCLFVTKFFESRNVAVEPVERLFKDITGVDKMSNKLLEVMNGKDIWQEWQVDNPNRVHTNKSAPIGNSRFK